MLAGCILADDYCTPGPIPTLGPASLSVIPGADQPHVDDVGACPALVEYDGVRYQDTRGGMGLFDVWTLTDDNLTPIGRATAAMPTVLPFADDTVYAVEGVDPGDAIAMRGASPRGQIVVLFANAIPFPDELCPYFRSPPRDQSICH